MIQKILFPVDFSASCVAMAAYVQRTAAIFGAKVTLVHGCDLNSLYGFELYARPASEIAEEHWNLAREKLEGFLLSEFPTAGNRRVLMAGDAASLVSEIAKKEKYDLILMPTHAGRFRRMLLGSTTAKVLDDAECPVLTMQHAADIAPRSLDHRKWVCAIALAPDSERVLRYARDAALAAGAELSLIHALRSSAGESEAQNRSEYELRARKRFAELQKKVGCDVPVGIAVGPVKQTLLDRVRESSADVLVVGRSPRGGAFGRLRDLTYSLVRDSPCPVVSV